MASRSLQRFVGKLAVVTGASSGMGKAIAENLVRQGVIVAGVARRVERITDHATKLKEEKGKLHAYQCDLKIQDQILATFKKITSDLGPIHVMVNNAGLMYASDIIDGDIEKWKAALDTNVLALAICTREAVASMNAHNIKGHIININSVEGHKVNDFPSVNIYPATKYAVTALTETVRLEINRMKLPIKITSISPGFVKTEFVEVAFGPQGAIIVKNMQGLKPEDIADAVLYVLATPEHVNVTELEVIVQGSYI